MDDFCRRRMPEIEGVSGHAMVLDGGGSGEALATIELNV